MIMIQNKYVQIIPFRARLYFVHMKARTTVVLRLEQMKIMPGVLDCPDLLTV